MTLVRLLIAICCAVAAFAVPQTALAVGPVTTPKILIAETFEPVPAVVTYVTSPTPGSVGYWGKRTTPAVLPAKSGFSSLYCYGTHATRVQYAEGTGGYATFNLTQTVDFYKPIASFFYSFPSYGYSDALAFAPEWAANGAAGVSSAAGSINKTGFNVWVPLSVDLSTQTTSKTSLSRAVGMFRLRWQDVAEPPNPSGIAYLHVGQGVSVDDVTISGWRFGPVRSLSATTTALSSTLTWLRPWRSATPTETSAEERPLSYRVWRAPKGTSAWAELTPAVRVANASTAVTYADTTVTDGTAYSYAVQAWEPGSGDETTAGFGEHVSIDATTKPLPLPLVSISSPTSGSVIVGADPVSVSGTVQALEGASVSSVMLSVKREDNWYYNFTVGTWTPTPSTVSANVSGNVWSAWTPSTNDTKVHTYTITVLAKDSRNKSATAAVAVKVTLSADTVPPRIISARSIGRYAIEVRFSEQPFAPGGGSIDARYFSARGLQLRKIISWSKDGTRVRIMTSAQPAAHASYRVMLRKPVVDALGN